MVRLNWCFKQSKGLKFIDPNLDITKEYLKDAKRDFSLVNRAEPKWNIIKEYYVCYNAFYSLLVKCGIKCEIHDCTLMLMNLFGFDDRFQRKLNELKRDRIGVQYYLSKLNKDYYSFAKEFLEFCEVRFLELNDLEIKEIRNKLMELKNE